MYIWCRLPLNKVIDVIVEYLKNQFSIVKARTKLKLADIHQLIKLCVSECYFLHNNLIWKFTNQVPLVYLLWLFSQNNEGFTQYIFAILFCMSKRVFCWNKEKCFLFHFENPFRSRDNQILTFQVFKCHGVMKCLSMKHETYFTE